MFVQEVERKERMMFLVVDTKSGYNFKRFTLNGVKRKLIKLCSEPKGMFGTIHQPSHIELLYIRDIKALDENTPEFTTSCGDVFHWSVRDRYMIIKY